MISSRNTLSSLEQALRGVRRDEDNLALVLRNASEELSQLRTAQADAFRSLARLRLDTIKQGEVIGQIDAVESKALKLIEQWQGRLNAAVSERSVLQQEIASAEDERLEKVDSVDAAVEAVEDFKASVESEIKSDSEWRDRNEQVRATAEVAQAAEKKAVTAESDLDSKGAPYKADPLFMYLWNADFGTARYKGSGITHFMDGRIASLIGYHNARQDYHMLTEIPKRLRQHADDISEKVRSAGDALETVERKLLEARGIAPLEEAAEQEHAGLTHAEERLNELREAFDRRAKEEELLLDPQNDKTYREAVSMLAEALGREDLNRLWQEARQTQTTEDEGIVKQLEQNVSRISAVEHQISDARQTIANLAQRKAELEQSRARFYRSGYDNPIGGFSNGDLIGAAIGEVLSGALKSGQLGDLFDQGYQPRRRPRRGGLGGAVRLPSQGPWTGGGALGGRSHGRTRPGGFRTTGGF